MFEEALSDVSPSTNFKSSRNLPSSNTDIDILRNNNTDPRDLQHDELSQATNVINI